MDKTNKRFFNLLTKTVFVFLVLVLPLYVLNIFFIQSLKAGIRHQFMSSMDSNLRYFVTSLEQEMDRVLTLRNKTLFDQDVLAISTMAEILTAYERAEAILRIKSRLTLIKDSSLFIENIGVFISPINRIISTKHFDDSIDGEEAQALIRGAASTERPISEWQGQFLISAVYPAVDQIWYADRSFIYAIKIELSLGELRKALASINSHGGAMLMDNGQTWSITARHNDDNDAQIASYAGDRIASGKEVPKNEKLEAGSNNYLLSYASSALLGATVMTYVPENAVYGGVSKYSYWFWAVSLFSLLVITYYSSWIYRLIHHPVQRLVLAFRKVEKGNFDIRLNHRTNDEFSYLYKQFNATVKQLQQLIHENYEQQIRYKQTELKQLQSQINPHFLYNSFFVLYRLIDFDDSDNAKRMARYLGEYFRVITNTAMDELTLEAEINHAFTYAEIQHMRFAEQLSIVRDPLPDSFKHVAIPRLVLQPIIENAFEHGLENLVDPGELRVGFGLETETIVITIENSGNLTDSELQAIELLLQTAGSVHAGGQKYGLVNVQKRLQLKYGEPYGLFVSRSQLGGLKVEIRIPGGEQHVQIVDR